MERHGDSSTQLKHFFDVAWRRKWWVVAPAALVTALGFVLVGTTPKVFRATTTILVTRQGIPEGIARSSVTLRVEERMRTLELQLRSRSYLEQIARTFDLVAADATEVEIEGACRKLRGQVTLELDRRDFSWFRISVDDVDPKQAAGIANRLAGLFIEEHAQLRASQAAGTLEATTSWEQRYALELGERERAASEFKQQNVDALPDQQPFNLQLLGGAQSRVAQLALDIRSRDDRLAALRQQQEGQLAIAVASAEAAGNDPDRAVGLERELELLLASYTEENPLVRRKQAQIAEFVRPPPPAAAAAVDPFAVEIATVEAEIAGMKRDRARESAVAATYSARIAGSPELQPRLLALTRDSDQAKHQFDIAMAQNDQAQHAQDLEESKHADQLQIQDLAYPPAVPYKPNVLAHVLAVLGLGLLIGVAAAVAREFVDQTLRGEDAFAAAFPGTPIYGVIPSLDIDATSRRV